MKNSLWQGQLLVNASKMKTLLIIFAFAVLKTKAIVLNCRFKNKEYGYACEAEDMGITSKSDRFVTEARGKHLEGKTDCDVKYFIAYATVNYFPKNLEVIFPSMESIYISEGHIKEITSDDIKPFGERLKNLWFAKHEIQVLDGDLFDYTPNIEWASFYWGGVRHVDKGLFGKLKKLKILKFSYEKCLDESGYADSSSSIKSLISRLESKCQNSAVKSSNDQYKELSREIALLKGKNSISGAVEDLKSVKNTIFELYGNSSSKLNECARPHVTTLTVDKIKSLILHFITLKEEQSKMWTFARSTLIELIALMSTVCDGRPNSIDCGFIQTEVQRLNVFFTVPSGCLIF